MVGLHHRGNEEKGDVGYSGGEDWEGGGQPYKPIHKSSNFILNLSNFYFTSASVQGMSSRNNKIL
jgi:hypothetical protein